MMTASCGIGYKARFLACFFLNQIKEMILWK